MMVPSLTEAYITHQQGGRQMSDDHIRLVSDEEDALSERCERELGITLAPGDSVEDIRRLELEIIATLKLSGTTIKVGVPRDTDEPSIWLWTDDAGEVTYISPVEARLLIASLQLAVHETTGKDA